jgi:hypothetical protein
MSLLSELRRRNVFLAAFAYAVLGWLLLELVGLAVAHGSFPGWVYRFTAASLLICFPACLVFSWIYEITPEGIKREYEVDREQSITPRTGQRLKRITLAALALIIAINLVRSFTT